MKRVGNLYQTICSMDNLKLAHKNARRGKGWYEEVRKVNANEDELLQALQQKMIDHTYRTSEYVTFTRTEGKKERLIYKLPYYPDRIYQWAIIQVIEPYLVRNLIDQTYSAIPGRGIHKAAKDIRKAIDSDPEGTKYCLKLDIHHYYPSINHKILKEQYRKLFKDPELLSALDEIIDSTPGNKGVPIGNYMSQYSGNLYLSQFDHWMKEYKHIKYYYRYMDDIVVLAGSKKKLHQLYEDIKIYMIYFLDLQIKDNWQVFPTFVRGLDFVGYRFFKDFTLLRKSTCQQFKRKMLKIRAKVESGQEMNYSEWCSMNSYNGWLLPCDSYRLRQKYLEPPMPYANQYYNKHVRKG